MKKRIIYTALFVWLIFVQIVYATQYYYDDLNRLIRVEYDSGTVVEYVYDKAGNILQVITHNSSDSWDPKDPKDPSDPKNPEDPKEPNDPKDPKEPKDPSEPKDPENPKEPNIPKDPEEPKNPDGPKDPASPHTPETSGNISGNNTGVGSVTNVGNGSESEIVKIKFNFNKGTYEINGEKVTLGAPIYISKNNRVLIPVRYIAPAINVEDKQIKWDNTKKILTIEGNKKIVIELNKEYMVVDGIQVKLNEKAQIINGRVYLPIADIARAFGIKYSWDNNTKELSIY